MAKDDTDKQIDSEIERGDTGVTETRKVRKDKYVASYQMVGDTAVPVSKAHGKLWQSRKDQGLSQRKHKKLDRAWNEAIRYYRNDQVAHRYDQDGDGEYAGNESSAMKMQRRFSETENIVFANTSALVPTLYAKNPTAEFTALDPEDRGVSMQIEKLTNRVLSKKAYPGVNLKPKVRKAVVMTTLTNASYIEVGYTFREQSSDQAMKDLATLSNELQKASTPQKVREIEGKIDALEQTVDVLRPAGPFVKSRRPQDVIVDPDSIEDDMCDARWIMIRDYIATSYLNAKFTQMKGQTRVSAYKPTHIVRAGDMGDGGHNSAEHEIGNYSLFNDDENKENASEYGYNDEETYRKAQRTCCWWVWDKITQRVLLYSDKDWTWPIWVWDDPYHLQGFFPIYKLQFNTDPEEPIGKGEVTYYLDQQDALNTINSEMKQARQWARRNVFFDKNKISAAEVERFIKGDEDVAVGVDVPEGMNIKDFVQSVVPPSMSFVELFDKQPILEAIDRISSVQPVMRGVEFKTNTTNQAINQYNSVQQTRTDEKIDAVEDFIGQIAWAISQLCLQFMDATTVEMLIGRELAAGWKNLSAYEIAVQLQMTVVGGSTQKPTSEAKKQQALQMGQVLGQFVNAAPVPVLRVLLETLRGAFNDVIPDEQWGTIISAIDAQAQQPPTGASNGSAPSGSEREPPSQQGGADPIQVLEQLVDQMPPEAKQALGMAMARGVPVRKALERIIPATQGGAQQQRA